MDIVGVNLSQITETTTEILPDELADRKVCRETQHSQIENDLFLSLKLHIDSQNKLIQLYQTRIQSFERFRKYCQSLAYFGDGNTANKFDLQQFQNEFNRFDQNYRYFRKRIRKLQKQTETSMSIRYQSPYDTLYELFAKIESLERNKDNETMKKHDDRYLSDEQIYPEISIDVMEPHELAVRDTTVDDINYDSGDAESVTQSKRENIQSESSKTLEENAPTNNETARTQERLKCFVQGCGQIYTEKDCYLEHLFEHSIDVGQARPGRRARAVKRKPAPQHSPEPSAKRRTRNRTAAKNAEKMMEEDESRPRTNFKCDFEGCNFYGRDSYALRIHAVVHSDIRPFKCDQCEMAFKLKGVLKTHIRIIHEGIRYEGNKNKDNSTSKPRQTKKKSESKKRRSPKKPALDEKAIVYQCEYSNCKYSTTNKSSMNTHKLKHSDLRPFKCDQCEMAFKINGSLKMHQKVVHEGKRFECTAEGCSASLWSKNSLRQHINIFHTKDPKIYRCSAEGCDYTSFKVEALRRHSAVHSDDRPFKCMWPGCGKAFKAYVTRKDHILMHKNERRFKCKWPDCSYACNTTNNLRKHHVLHERKIAQRTDPDSNQLNIKIE